MEIDPSRVDRALAELDRRLSAQIDAILHAPAFQRLEAAWRELAYVVAQIDFRENIRLSFLDLSWDALRRDLATDDPRASGFASQLSWPRGSCGGMPRRPPSLVVLRFAFSTDDEDAARLARIAQVAARSTVIVLAGADRAEVEADAAADGEAWCALRERPESRFLGLCVTRFLLRPPYVGRADDASFAHHEEVIGHPSRALYGEGAAALATVMARSFARYRWCVNIVGPSDGAVLDVPIHTAIVEGRTRTLGPVDVRVSQRREYELSEQGFIAAMPRGEDGAPTFFSATSLARRESWVPADADDARLTAWLSAWFPHAMVIARVATYARAMMREQLGRPAEEVEQSINAWLAEYVHDMDAPPPPMGRRRVWRPFRRASIEVAEQGRCFAYALRLEPGFRYMGGRFTLAMSGAIDRD